ncbi:NUDIX domain-containing protein [Yinghuangia sp. YIM S09857]|uniref:NUDIX domain-containing protein n=1 Tax=Yinghuangia sp. YIM S09857 TaxID=3436929 RepID=UPI003F5341B7
MVVKKSAGILLYRVTADSGSGPGSRADSGADSGADFGADFGVEVLIVHPGGPFWARKDAGAWSIPKGEYLADEAPLAAAVREFQEETGAVVDPAQAVELGSVTQRNGKLVTAWAVEDDFDVTTLVSNHFEMEWPYGSGVTRSFPEIDRALWCTPPVAREKLNPAQTEFVDRLLALLTPTA